MNKVTNLLRQAWEEARKEGVIITDVEFQITETMNGEFDYVRPRIDALFRPRRIT